MKATKPMVYHTATKVDAVNRALREVAQRRARGYGRPRRCGIGWPRT